MKDFCPIGSKWKLTDAVNRKDLIGKIYQVKYINGQIALCPPDKTISWNGWTKAKGVNFITSHEWATISLYGTWSRVDTKAQYLNLGANPCGEITLTPGYSQKVRPTKPCDCSSRDLLHTGHKCEAYSKKNIRF